MVDARAHEWLLLSRQELTSQRDEVYCDGRPVLRVGVQVMPIDVRAHVEGVV